MDNVTREEIGPLSAMLTVHVPSSSYKPKFDAKLKDFKKKAQLKGFRKGHTPEALVRKMYGESILAEVVQSEINLHLQTYIEAEKPKFFGEPMIANDQELMHFDVANMADYHIKFELGIMPEFELKGLDSSETIALPKVSVSESEIDKQVMTVRRRHGERTDLEDATIEDNDYVELHLEEWENEEKKPGGVHTHTHFLVNEQMSESLRNTMIGKTIKDTFHFDPYQAETATDDQATRKYILHLEEGAPETSRDFLARIDKITRVTPAEMNDEFFEKAFGPGQIADEAAMRAIIKQQLEQSFNEPIHAYAEVLMKVDLLEKNNLPLPEDFLRRWVTTRAEENQEKEEWNEEKFKHFFLDLRWSLIRDKIIEGQQIDVSEVEIIEAYKVKLREYFGGNADENMLNQLAPRVLTDKEFRGKLVDQVVRHKLASAFLSTVQLVQEEITPEGFRPWMEAAYEKIEKRFIALQS